MNQRLKLNPILIIDDEASILELLSTSLTKNGYAVDIAENGEEGIEKIESRDYSLIFTDIKMPGLSGEQVLQYLKYVLKNVTPVVGMSGTPWRLDHCEFDAVLAKPFSMKDFLKLARQFTKETV